MSERVYIGDYELEGPLQTANGGNCRWGFAKQGKSRFFIKELLSPVWPAASDFGLSEAVVQKKRMYCERFEQKMCIKYQLLQGASGSGLQPVRSFFRCENKYYIVMDAIDALPQDYILKEAFLPKERRCTCRVLLNGLRRMHEKGLIHGDVKLDNVLFFRLPSGFTSARLIDFEDSFFAADTPKAGEEVRCDQVYMAPETFLLMLGEERQLTPAIDAFALGLVMYQILTGEKQLMQGMEYRYPFEALCDGKELPLDYMLLPDGYREVIPLLLEKDPKKRIGLIEAETILADTGTASEPGLIRTPRDDIPSEKTSGFWVNEEGLKMKGLHRGTETAGSYDVREKTYEEQPVENREKVFFEIADDF